MNLLVCDRCGERCDVPGVELGPAIRCERCGHRRPFQQLPLFCVTGPSGSGKSAAARLLVGALAGSYVVLEQDVLWQAGLRDEAGDHRAFRSSWLRMAAMIHQSGRPVVLCGTVVPPEFEPLPERALFTDIHYLALMCAEDELARRLRARPAWRQWDEERVAETLAFSGWLAAEAVKLEPPVELLDTTDVSVADTARRIIEWVQRQSQVEGP